MCSITNVSSHQAVSLILKCPDLWAPYIPKNWTPTRIEVVSGNKISLAVGIKDLFSQNQSLSHVIWLCLPIIRISFSCEALSWSICVDLEKPRRSTVLLWQREVLPTDTLLRDLKFLSLSILSSLILCSFFYILAHFKMHAYLY